MGMSEHTTSKTGQVKWTAVFLVTYIHSLGEENTKYHVLRGKLCSIKKVKCPLVSAGGYGWLTGIIS